MRIAFLALILFVLAAEAPRADTTGVASEVRGLAAAGDAHAQYALGTMYRDGVCLAPDAAKARTWLERAAAQGLIDAQLALGNLYAESDRVASFKWFDIAAMTATSDWLRVIARSNRDAVTGRMTPAEIERARSEAEGWRARSEE